MSSTFMVLSIWSKEIFSCSDKPLYSQTASGELLLSGPSFVTKRGVVKGQRHTFCAMMFPFVKHSSANRLCGREIASMKEVSLQWIHRFLIAGRSRKNCHLWHGLADNRFCEPQQRPCVRGAFAFERVFAEDVGLETYSFNYNPTPSSKSTLVSSSVYPPTLCLHHEGLPRLE